MHDNLPPTPLPQSQQQPPSHALNVASGAAFGSICAYVRQHGNPYQISRTSTIINSVLSSSTPENPPDWPTLRQQLYQLCGDWLWLHASNYWRTRVVPRMQIPVVLMDCALRVEPVGNLGWSVMMPPEEKEEGEGSKRKKNDAKTTMPTRKSERKIRKKTQDEMLYLNFGDYQFEKNTDDGCFEDKDTSVSSNTAVTATKKRSRDEISREEESEISDRPAAKRQATERNKDDASQEEKSMISTKKKTKDDASQEEESMISTKKKAKDDARPEEKSMISTKKKSKENASEEEKSMISTKKKVKDNASQEKESMISTKKKTKDAASQEEESMISTKKKAKDNASQEKESMITTKKKAKDAASQEEESMISTKKKAKDNASQEEKSVISTKKKAKDNASQEEGSIISTKKKAKDNASQEEKKVISTKKKAKDYTGQEEKSVISTKKKAKDNASQEKKSMISTKKKAKDYAGQEEKRMISTKKKAKDAASQEEGSMISTKKKAKDYAGQGEESIISGRPTAAKRRDSNRKKRKINKQENNDRPPSSTYLGVFRRRGAEASSPNATILKWHGQVCLRGKSNLFIGKFKTEEEAAFAVDLMQCLINYDQSDIKYNISNDRECKEIWRSNEKFCKKFRGRDMIEVDDRPTVRKVVAKEVERWKKNRKGAVKNKRQDNDKEVDLNEDEEQDEDEEEDDDDGNNNCDDGSIKNVNQDGDNDISNKPNTKDIPTNPFIEKAYQNISKLASCSSNEPWISPLYYLLLFIPAQSKLHHPQQNRKISIISCRVLHHILSSQAEQSFENNFTPNMDITDYSKREQMAISTLVKCLKHGSKDKENILFSLAKLLNFLKDTSVSAAEDFSLVGFVQEICSRNNDSFNPGSGKNQEEDVIPQSTNLIVTAIEFIKSTLQEENYDVTMYENMEGTLSGGLNMVLAKDLDDAGMSQLQGEEEYKSFLICMENVTKGHGGNLFKMPLLNSC